LGLAQFALIHQDCFLFAARDCSSIAPMKTFQLVEHGVPGRFELRDVPDPKPARGEMVVDGRTSLPPQRGDGLKVRVVSLSA
jgi:hypothetical protein